MTPKEIHEGTQLMIHYILVLEGIIGALVLVVGTFIAYVWRNWTKRVEILAANCVTRETCENAQKLLKSNHVETMKEIKENRRLILHHEHDDRGKVRLPPGAINNVS